jgi:hypothetical protein
MPFKAGTSSERYAKIILNLLPPGSFFTGMPAYSVADHHHQPLVQPISSAASGAGVALWLGLRDRNVVTESAAPE